MKKLVSVLLAVLMLASLTGGLASAEGERDTHITLTVALWDAESFDEALAQVLKDTLNIDIECRPLSWDNSDEQTRLFAISGDMPDVIGAYPVDNASMFYSWMDQGLIRSIPKEMIEKYPLVAELFENDPTVQAVAELKDGEYWYVPRPESFTGLYVGQWNGIYYRMDWVEKLGLQAPATMDEFYDMLVAFKENNVSETGTTVPLSIQMFAGEDANPLFCSWGTVPSAWYKQEDGRWIPGYSSDEMLKPLSFLRKLYEEGLLDPEFASNSRNAMLQKLAGNIAGVIMRNADVNWINTVLVRQWSAANGNADPIGVIGLLNPLAVDGEVHWPLYIPTCGSYISSSVSDEKLDRILDWMNFSLSPEGRVLYRYGIGGETYDVVDGEIVIRRKEDGTPVFGSGLYPSLPFGSIATWDFDAAADITDPNNGYPKGILEMGAVYREACNAAVMPEVLLPRFLSTPTKDEFNPSVADEFSQIVTGTDSVEDMFNAYKAKLDSMGLQAMIDEVTAEMERLGH